nr:unnamed protein product [Callosobruchus analis]
MLYCIHSEPVRHCFGPILGDYGSN